MKHNQAIDCNQFKKDIHPLIKTWHNQPARHQRRRLARQVKLAKRGTRPMNNLRPLVQCCTDRYNHKARLGRGFTVDELKAVKLNSNMARSVGISVDARRRNRSEELKERNVARLRDYLAHLVIFPKKEGKAVAKVIGGLPAESLRDSIKGKTLVTKLEKPRSKAALVTF